jgi:hypothetical protein
MPLHPRAADVVAHAMREGHAVDPVRHFDAIARLDRAARDESATDLQTLLDVPMPCGDGATPLILRRLTFAAIHHYNAHFVPWWTFDQALLTMSLAWLMANGRSRAALEAMLNEPTARVAIAEWVDSLTCTPDQLAIAVNALLPESSPLPNPRRSALLTQGPMYARLIQHCGHSLDHWLYEESDARVGELLASIRTLERQSLPEEVRVRLQFAEWQAAKRAFLDAVSETPDTFAP